MISMEDIRNLVQETQLRRPLTIILWGREDLLMQAVASLLIKQNDWRVIRISDEASETQLVEQIQTVYPQVLIVHQDTLLGNLPLLIKFIQTCSKLKIITINLDNNGLEIFNKQTTCLKEVSDLMAIIADDSQSKGGKT